MSARAEEKKTTTNGGMNGIQDGGVREWFNGKHVLVTGATGFMGKVLVEKLLRSCPDVNTIYLLMRPKRGSDVTTRFQEYVKNVIFDGLRSDRPAFTAQLRPIAGDVTLPGLGLHEQELQLLVRSVHVVFHCAANVRFDLTLKTAVQMNTGGTLQVLQLAEKMQNLEVFLHVSTSYCHCDQEVLEERTYDAKADPRELLRMMKWMDDDCLETIKPKQVGILEDVALPDELLGNLPNTYAFSKNLSEGLVQEYADKFRVGISRPSIVVSSWKEPLPGFVDNLNGPVGLLVAAGKGVLRSMHCKPDYVADVIPVDFAINTLIGQAWLLAVNKHLPSPWVVNACATANHITWSELIETGRKLIYKYPFSQVIWYPDGSLKSSRITHDISCVLFHVIPAYCIDMLLTLCRQKTFMVRVQQRIQGGLTLLQYYTTKPWRFNTDNVRTIDLAMSVGERDVFYTDMDAINWESYMEKSILGTRLYCLKEDPATLPRARRNIRRLYWLDQVFSWLFYALLVYLLIIYFPPIRDFTERSIAAFTAPFHNQTPPAVTY